MSTGFPDYLSGFQQPSSLYVAAGDVLRVAAASSQAGETITVNYRIWQSNRAVKKGQFTISPNSSRAISTHDEVMVEGFLLSLSCKAAAATTRGQTFVRAFLTDSAFGLGQPSAMLMSDYVTTQTAPGYPNGRVLSPNEGPGWLHQINVANPAAGVDWLTSVPTNARWRIKGIVADLTASAAPADRFVYLFTLLNGSGGIWSPPAVIQRANEHKVYSWGPCLPTFVTQPGTQFPGSYGDKMFGSLPEDLILTGPSVNVIGTSTEQIDAGDQWANIYVSIEEWLDNV